MSYSLLSLFVKVVQINKLPLIVSFIASSDCNTGHILDLEKKIDPVLNQLRSAVADAWWLPIVHYGW